VADFSFYLPLSLGLNSQEFLVSCLRLQFSVSENFVNMLTDIVNFRDLILHSAVFGLWGIFGNEPSALPPDVANGTMVFPEKL